MTDFIERWGWETGEWWAFWTVVPMGCLPIVRAEFGLADRRRGLGLQLCKLDG